MKRGRRDLLQKNLQNLDSTNQCYGIRIDVQ
jgi:hypothetical protein